MNARKAKLLRRMAERATVGLPMTVYKKNQRGCVVLGGCTRRAYQQAKKAARLS